MPEPDLVHVVPTDKADERNRLLRTPSEDKPQ